MENYDETRDAIEQAAEDAGEAHRAREEVKKAMIAMIQGNMKKKHKKVNETIEKFVENAIILRFDEGAIVLRGHVYMPYIRVLPTSKYYSQLTILKEGAEILYREKENKVERVLYDEKKNEFYEELSCVVNCRGLNDRISDALALYKEKNGFDWFYGKRKFRNFLVEKDLADFD